jgi:hypothetical protein
MAKWQKFDNYDDYRKDLYRRLAEKIRFEIGSGCWIWQGFEKLGYGMTYVRGYGNTGAHRAMWIAKYGDPGELDVLHNCNNKLCISPLHLHLGTHKQNFKEASEAKLLQGQWKTHCKRGHPLSGDNLLPFVPGRKWRSCKKCDEWRRQTPEYKAKARERQRRQREKRRAAQQGALTC